MSTELIQSMDDHPMELATKVVPILYNPPITKETKKPEVNIDDVDVRWSLILGYIVCTYIILPNECPCQSVKREKLLNWVNKRGGSVALKKRLKKKADDKYSTREIHVTWDQTE